MKDQGDERSDADMTRDGMKTLFFCHFWWAFNFFFGGGNFSELPKFSGQHVDRVPFVNDKSWCWQSIHGASFLTGENLFLKPLQVVVDFRFFLFVTSFFFSLGVWWYDILTCL